MSIARRMTAEEVLSLPLGAVVWYEDHVSYNDPAEGIYGIPNYFLYPVMVADDKDFTLIGAIEGSVPEYWTSKDIPRMRLWNTKPEKKQIRGLYHADLDNIPVKTLRKLSDGLGIGSTALKKRIVWEYGSVRAFAKQIGMSEYKLSKKLKGEVEFVASEIASIRKIMHLGRAETIRYFFVDMQTSEKIS